MKTRESRSVWKRLVLTTAFALSLHAHRADAFSLLGPYEDWMQPTNGYRLRGDIGAAMRLEDEFRWNVRVVTYGFDPSFKEYFGASGVQAVKEAIRILNDLPRASDIELTDYPLDTRRVNSTASSLGLYDLKSVALALVLEHLGLAAPTENIYNLLEWRQPGPPFVQRDNYDPFTLEISHSVNGTLYTGQAVAVPSPDDPSVVIEDVFETAIDPLEPTYTAVMDGFTQFFPGYFFTGLTRDDVGGLRYLLDRNNTNNEPLLPDVRGTSRGYKVRRGVEKILFVRQPYLPGAKKFKPMTFHFTTTYITEDGKVVKKRVTRKVREPDFLFRAGDTGAGKTYTAFFERTDTSNWTNPPPSGGGLFPPGGIRRRVQGIIRPPVDITFHKLGKRVTTSQNNFPQVTSSHWGSFDLSTNPPVAFPAPEDVGSAIVRLRWHPSDDETPVTTQAWIVPAPYHHPVALETSTNQVNWTTLAQISNTGGIIEWNHYGTAGSQMYFRARYVLPPPSGTGSGAFSGGSSSVSMSWGSYDEIRLVGTWIDVAVGPTNREPPIAPSP